jgi:GT2 family glycosyltransferase
LSTIAARRLGLGRILGNTLDSYLHRDKPESAVFDCDWLSGCFLMVRRQAVDEVGLLDLRFQKYFEDVDFCLRMGRAGWRVMMNGRTYCYHLEQRASRRVFSKDAFIHVRSYVQWLLKWGLNPQRQIARAETRRRAA